MTQINPVIPRQSIIAAGLVSLAVFIADQLTKWLVLKHFNALERCPNGSAASVLCDEPLIPLFSLTMVWNPGVSMGMIQHGTDIARWGITIVTALISLAIGWWVLRERDSLQRLGLALVLGGALGNIIDRIRYGAVADFIRFTPELPLIGQFWVFNVADAAISIGVMLLILRSFTGTPDRQTDHPPQEGQGS
jgi:signal peptidase II